MASKIATYEYLNSISSYDMPYDSNFPNALKKCVNAYDFTMNKNYSGYFFDLEYTGTGTSSPPWPLCARDKFSVRDKSDTYHCKLTLNATPTGWKTRPIVINAGVWNGMRSGIVGNSTQFTASQSSTYASLFNPAVYLQGGYANSSDSPIITSTSGGTFVKGNVFDVIGTEAGTYSNPIIGLQPRAKVLSLSYTNNTTTTVSLSISQTVYVAFFYFSNNDSSKYYVNWVPATLSSVYEARWT